MLLDHKKREALSTFFQRITLQNEEARTAKIGQILGYLEIIHAQLRQYSPKRPIVCIECGAGNAYLSFLLSYFYTKIENTLICATHSTSPHCSSNTYRKQISYKNPLYLTDTIAHSNPAEQPHSGIFLFIP